MSRGRSAGGDFEVVVRTPVGLVAAPEEAMPGEMTPGRDVDRRGRIGGHQPDDIARRKAAHPLDQLQQQLAARTVATIDDVVAIDVRRARHGPGHLPRVARGDALSLIERRSL
jgi:hypothetical protein